MKKHLTLLFTALLLAAAATAGTYKWVDKDGKVHYSDKPVEGAEAVELPTIPTYESPVDKEAMERRRRERADAAEAKGETEYGAERAAYREFYFISPKPDQVFWALGGKLPVQLSLKPSLKEGDRVVLFLNGEKAATLQGLGTTLDEVYRGAYTLRAVVQGPDGAAKISAESGQFFVKQQSIANPP